MTGAGIVALLFREIEEEGRKTLRSCPDKKRGHELLMASKAYFGWCLVGGLVGSGSLSGLFSRSCGNRQVLGYPPDGRQEWWIPALCGSWTRNCSSRT
jgi:hypothetical protein